MYVNRHESTHCLIQYMQADCTCHESAIICCLVNLVTVTFTELSICTLLLVWDGSKSIYGKGVQIASTF